MDIPHADGTDHLRRALEAYWSAGVSAAREAEDVACVLAGSAAAGAALATLVALADGSRG